MKKIIRPFTFGIMCFAVALFYAAIAISTKNLDYKFNIVGFGGTFNSTLIRNIPLYEGCFIIGILMMFVILYSRRALYEFQLKQILIITIALVIFGLLGTKILFALENIEVVKKNGIRLNLGGVSFFGAVINIPIVFFVICKICKINYYKIMDYCAPAGLVMITAMRFGCFFKGCCGGIQLWVGDSPLIIPVQMIECGLDLILLDVILSFEKKQRMKNKLYIIFLIVYSCYRFILEFIRNSKIWIMHLSNGQVWSLICILVGAIILMFMYMREGENEKR